MAKRVACSGLFTSVLAATLAMSSAAFSADLVIAMPNWPSGQATANILKVSIGKEFGLNADVQEMGTLLAFNGLEKARWISTQRSGNLISKTSSSGS